MSTVSLYSKQGVKQTATVTLPKEVFAVEVKDHEALKYTYTAYLANGRSAHAKALSRGEVRGGGRKPWKQKGTGRARFGSIRVPQWRGGGIVHAPTGNENFTKTIGKATKRTALRQALSIAAAEKRIIAVETFAEVSGKTADFSKLLTSIEAKGNVLVVTDHITEKLEQATRNLPQVTLTHANYLNTFNLVNADTIVCTKEAIDKIAEWLKEAK